MSEVDKELVKEYDATFSNEEKVLHKLSVNSEVTREIKEIPLNSIVMSHFKKKGREVTVKGLTGVVGEWGVVTPIHVMTMEEEGEYQMLDGVRRVFAAYKDSPDGSAKIPAVVWDFEDKAEGKEMANILSLLINRTQKFSPKEMWEQLQILERVNTASPGLIEYLLQMESGDAMKLKDVMLAEGDEEYDDFRDGLMNGKYSIDQAYKKLTNKRKKEDKLEQEDNISVDKEGFKDTQNEILDGVHDEEERPRQLDDTEVKEILEIGGLDSGGLDVESVDAEIEETDIMDLDKTDEIRGKDAFQETGKRTFIDSAVKQNTLIRDDFKCRACGLDGKSGMYLGILVYHHIIPVFLGGPDTVENGLTLCSNCHITLHNYLMGKVQVNKEMLTEEETKIFKNIFKYGNIAIEAQKRKGMSKKEFEKLDAPSRKHMMPGTGLKDNKEALATSGVEVEDVEIGTEDIE